jgi:hypothetical protein
VSEVFKPVTAQIVVRLLVDYIASDPERAKMEMIASHEKECNLKQQLQLNATNEELHLNGYFVLG